MKRTLDARIERDHRILRAMSRGMEDREIAKREGLSPGTMRVYNCALYKRLKARNRAHAVAIYLTQVLHATEQGLSVRAQRRT